jgi:threonine dehydratase
MIELSDIEAAAQVLAGIAHRTPVVTSRTLDGLVGATVYLKPENLQRGGAFKFRGAYNRIASLADLPGVAAFSSGNHAQAVAIAAGLLGTTAVILMPEDAPAAKVEATRGYGAEIVLHGTIWDEANEKALELVDEQGLTYIHPFDDLDLIAGQGTVGLEIYDDLPSVETVVVPIGGGGLISGVSMALKSIDPEIRVIGVESSGAPAMKLSVEAGERVQLDEVDCVIDGLTVKRVGELTLDIVRRHVDEIVTLPDEQIFEALLWTMARTKIVVEGAAAAPVGALLNGLMDAETGETVVCVLSGGNLKLDQLSGLSWN